MADVVFHAGSKLSWLEAIARDRRATAFDLRVATAISNRTNGDGIARTASQQWIARYIGATERGVRKSIVRLEAMRHIEPIKNALGAGGDGRPAFGGNGHATEYRLLKTTRNGGSGFGDETRNSATRNSEAANREQRSSEPGTAVPIFPYTSNKDSLARAHAHARDPGETAWLAVRKRLTDEVGGDVFDAWFGKVALVSIEAGKVVLRSPSKFQARNVEQKFGDRVLWAWQAEDASVTDVRIEYALVSEAVENVSTLRGSRHHGSPEQGADVADWQRSRNEFREAFAQLREFNASSPDDPETVDRPVIIVDPKAGER